MLRKAIIFFPFILFLFLIGFSKEYHLPKIKTWTLVKLESFSEQHLPVKVLAKNFDISLWPPSISFFETKLIPQKKLAQKLAPVTLKNFSLSLELFGLLTGKLKLLDISINSAKVTLIQKPSKNTSSQDDPLKIPFKEILAYPIRKLTIRDMQLQTQIQHKNIISQVNDLDLKIEFLKKRLLINLSSPQIIIKQKGKRPKLTLSVKTQFFTSNKNIQISAFQLRKGSSFIIASGSFAGNIETLKILNSNLNIRSFFSLTQLKPWLKDTLPHLKIPQSDGSLKIDISAQKKNLKPINIDFKASSKSLDIEGYKIGDVNLSGAYDLNKFTLPQLTIKNNSGLYRIKDLSFKMKDDFNFNGSLNLQKVEFSQLIENIRLPKSKIHMNISSQLPCKGKVKPHFFMQCNGFLIGENFNIPNTVALDKFKATGKLKVTHQEINYESDLEVSSFDSPNKNSISKGKSTGTINYQNGFDIKYSSNSLNFSHVKNLASLKLSGKTKLDGFVKGNSNSAIFEIDTHSKNYWFEDIFLGEIKTYLKYKKGILSFKKILGKIGHLENRRHTNYNGSLSLNFDKSLIFSSIQFPQATGKDIQKVLSKRLPLPFQLLGHGNGFFKVWGPLKKDLTNFEYGVHLQQGSFASEPYDDLKIHIVTDKGILKTKKLYFTKGDSKINISGESSAKSLTAKVTGSKIRLEDSGIVQNLGFNLSSQFDFLMKVNGPLGDLKTQFEGRFSKTSVGNHLLPPSSVSLSFSPDYITGSGQLFGKNITSDFTFPLKPNGNFKLKTNVNNLNFIPFFGVINDSIQSLNYKSNLKAQIDLSSENGGILNSSGQLTLDDFNLSRDDQNIRSIGKSTIILKKGAANAPDLQLKGKNSFVKSQISNSSSESINATFNGQFDLSLLAFLNPIIEDLRGPVSFSFKFGGSYKKPEFLGSLFVDDGFLKLKKFPHPFERIKADILISQSKLLINSFKSVFAGGQLSSDGRVLFQGWQKTPININISAKQLSLKYPADTATQGEANINVKGDWFPFNITGNIAIQQSEFTREFTAKKENNNILKSSPFLPGLILKKQVFNPATLNLKVQIKDNLHIKNSLINGKFKGDFSVTGPLLAPTPEGLLRSLKGGQIFFKETPFEISEASADFDKISKKNLDPQLYFTAKTRFQEHDISLLLQGRSSKPEIKLSSEPSLSEQDIVSLLALGITSSDTDKLSSEQQSNPTAILGSALSQSFIGKEIKDNFGVKLQFSQAYDDDQGSIQKITISKQVSKKIDASATRSSGKDEVIDVKLKYKFNQNLSVIGRWKDTVTTEENNLINEENEDGKIFGLDLEYRVEFK